MKRTLFLTTTVFLLSISILKADSWKKLKKFPGRNRTLSFYFTINDREYVGGGLDSAEHLLKDFWEYNASTDSWTQKSDFPQAVWAAVGFSIGNKGYAGTGDGGGSGSSLSAKFWEYDPANDKWTSIADFGGGKRWVAIAFSIGNFGYVGTGLGPSLSYKSDLWQYDPLNKTWKQMASLPGSGIKDASAFSIGVKGYVLGDCYSANLWEYDPVNNTWSAKKKFPGTARCDAAAFSICGKGYYGTGEISGGSVFANDLYEYDPVADTWTKKLSFQGTARDETVSFAIGNKGYIGLGGEDGWATSDTNYDLWEYTPDSSCLNPKPVSFFHASDTTICAGKCISFTNLSIYAASYFWNFPGATPSIDTSFSPIKICYANPGTYDVSLISINGNVSDTLILKNYITVLEPTEAGVVTALHDTICPGTFAKLNVSGTSGPLQWQSSYSLNNFSNIIGATSTSLIDMPSKDIYYRVYAGSGSCSDSSVAYKIYVAPELFAIFANADSGLEIKFNSSGSTGDITSYYWEFGDSTYSNQPNPVHIYDTAGYYHVCLTVDNGAHCPYTICRNITVYNTGLNSLNKKIIWSIYPDPVGGQLIVRSDHEVIRIEIKDLLGRKIIQEVLFNEETSIDVSLLSPGVYFAVLKGEQGKEQIKKFIKK